MHHFIDEIDAIGKTRDTHGGNDEREQTLNQNTSSEMDGFDASWVYLSWQRLIVLKF